MSKQRSLLADGMVEQAATLFRELRFLDGDAKIDAINRIRLALREHSPFASEPVDCVQWVPADDVVANDWNPNSVAPPEMKLLEHSILEDGYTQPIVTYISEGDQREVVDGFHRNRVGKECAAVRKRVKSYLPVVTINEGRADRGDRIAATIRHNRARGKHRVEGMSEIVIELKRRNWSDEKIGRELGMDPDEVLRLTQISGLAEMFKDREFSEAWEAENSENGITDVVNEADNLDVLEENPGDD
jgi:ParB-like chromosome segregation protein Spo0J